MSKFELVGKWILQTGRIAGFVKIVHMQLPHEASEIRMLEICRKNGSTELLPIGNNEFITGASPSDNVGVGRVL
jgi:hypothetical protein